MITNLDKASFEALFHQNYRAMCMYAQNFVRDIDVVEDIVHDIFINLWEKRDSIEEEKSIKSYLFRSVHNRCLNYIRDTKKFVDSEEFDKQSEIVSINYNEGSYETAELESQIQEAINSLPEKCREVFIKSRFEELKYSEIAEILNISIKTVENQISKALKILREKLGDYLPTIIFFCFFLFKE